MSHTPGPWEWENNPFYDGKPYIRIKAGCGYYHSEQKEKGFDIGGLTTEDDARLIAAAPDLLHALDCILHRHLEDEFIPTEFWDMAKDAISRAKGEA